MKTLFFSLAILVTGTAIASTEPIELSSNLDAISRAINSGDAQSLAAFFDSEVEIVTNGKSSMLSKADATAAVKSFFASNAPQGFSIAHKGTGRGNASHYCIGDLDTSSGSFRVYIYMKQVGSDQKIVELRFDK